MNVPRVYSGLFSAFQDHLVTWNLKTTNASVQAEYQGTLGLFFITVSQLMSYSYLDDTASQKFYCFFVSLQMLNIRSDAVQHGWTRILGAKHISICGPIRLHY